VPAARDHCRLDPFAAMAGDALDLKHGERHCAIVLIMKTHAARHFGLGL
jgi:hypothetical protein